MKPVQPEKQSELQDVRKNASPAKTRNNELANLANKRLTSASVSLPLSSSEEDEDDDDSMASRQRLRSVSPAAEALLLPRPQTRVLLWAMPRSISTAFFRAIMEGARIKVLLEPFSNSYYFGEERISQRYLDKAPTPGCRFSDITQLYEQPYTRYKSVFAKDMAYYLTSKNPVSTFTRLLPRGYMHTFLIRNPARSVASLYKLSIDKERTGWDWFNAAEAGFKELYQLFTFVTERLGQPAIVVDANDLIKNPRKILIRYCALTGLEFSEKMLSWKSIDYSLIEKESDTTITVPDSVKKENSSSVKISGVYTDKEDHEEDASGHKPGQQKTVAAGIEAAAEKQMSIPPEIFRGWQPWFEGVLSSTTFCEFSLPAPLPPSHSKPVPPTPPPTPLHQPLDSMDSSTVRSTAPLPAKVNECIAECMPYYEHLKKYKI